MAEEYFGQARELFATARRIGNALEGGSGSESWPFPLGNFSVVEDRNGQLRVYQHDYVREYMARAGKHPVLSRDPHANDLSQWFTDCRPGEVVVRETKIKDHDSWDYTVYNFRVAPSAQEHLERVRELVRKPSMDMDDR